VFVVIGAVFLLQQLSCSNFENNPLDANYSGNYQLSVSLNHLPDTLFPFRIYMVPWSDNGTDKFFRLSLATVPAGYVDTSILQKHKPAPLPLRFTGPFTGKLVVVGVRPNEVQVNYPFDVHVTNPYRIAVDSSTLSGASNVKLFVKDGSAVQSDSSLHVVWYINGARVDSLPYNASLSHHPQASSSFWAKAIIGDYTGATLQLDSIRVRLQQRPQPKIVIQDLTLSAPQGKPFTIAASITNADSVRWQSKMLSKDTTLASSQITWTWTGSASDTVIATAKNRFGAIGTSDTVIVLPKAFTYDLTVVAFPESMQVRTWTTWEVLVTRNGTAVPDSEVVYRWTMTGDTTGDTIRTSGGKREMYIAHEKAFNLSVVALVAMDSSYRTSASVTVNANRPRLTLSTTDMNTPLNVPISVVVRAVPGDAAATITAVKYRVDSNSATNTLQSDTLRMVYTTPGDKRATVWAEDNLGFTSDTAMVLVHVTTSKPYFQRESIDTSIFINDSIRIDATALSGTTGDSVLSWKWDLDNNGTWDSTTTVGFLDTTFRATGVHAMKIWCANSRGDSSQTLALRTITVLPGKPLLDSAVLSAQGAYLNDTVELRIVAHDTNGVVKSISLSWGQQSPLQIPTNKQVVDTTIQLSFSTAGTYQFTLTATDEDGQVSASFNARDSLMVDQGTPRVKGIIPDTVWYRSEVSCTISAEDNESISGYAFSSDNTTFSSWSTDSVFKYTFGDSGMQYLYVKVNDDDGNESAVYKDTVYVKAGYPSIDSITPLVHQDSLYVLDPRYFLATAHDPDTNVRTVYVNWNGDSLAQDSAEFIGASVPTTLTHTFALADTGLRTTRWWARDDDSLLSATATKRVYVKLGKPTATISFLDSVYIHKSNTFEVNGTDPNGTIAQRAVSWDSGLPFETSTDTAFTHTYLTEGLKQCRIFVRDSDGISSDTITKTVYVNLGSPRVTSVGMSVPAAQLFIRDTIYYTVKGLDESGALESIFASWNGDTVFEARANAVGDSGVFTYAFPQTLSGQRTIIFRLSDSTGITKDTSFVVNARLAAPVIDSLVPMVCWVRHNYTFSLFTHDTNSIALDSFEIDWDNNGTYDSANGTGTFSYAFDTTLQGNRTIRARVMDNDTNWTERSLNIQVNMGRPSAGPGATYGLPIQWVGDTLFYIYTGGNAQAAIDTSDSNGTCQKIYWDLSRDGWNDSTDVPKWTMTVTSNALYEMKAQVRDDDGIMSAPYLFYMYTDAPPLAPTVTHSASQGDSVTIYWKNKDIHDGDFTEYRVLLATGDEPDSTNSAHIFSDWKSGYQAAGFGSYEYKIRIALPESNPFGSTDYFYQVHARDNRGSITPCTSGHTFSY
jgi:hypothetical protein